MNDIMRVWVFIILSWGELNRHYEKIACMYLFICTCMHMYLCSDMLSTCSSRRACTMCTIITLLSNQDARYWSIRPQAGATLIKAHQASNTMATNSSWGEIEIASDGRPRRQKRGKEDWTDLKSIDSGEGRPSRRRQGDRGRDNNKEHVEKYLVTALCHHPSILLKALVNRFNNLVTQWCY